MRSDARTVPKNADLTAPESDPVFRGAGLSQERSLFLIFVYRSLEQMARKKR